MKNDLKHLRRSELIDMIYEMKKREIELQTRLECVRGRSAGWVYRCCYA